jgi:hypothetical protein
MTALFRMFRLNTIVRFKLTNQFPHCTCSTPKNYTNIFQICTFDDIFPFSDMKCLCSSERQ